MMRVSVTFECIEDVRWDDGWTQVKFSHDKLTRQRQVTQIAQTTTQILHHTPHQNKTFTELIVITLNTHTHTHTHTTVLLLFWNMSGTTWVSRHQKGKSRKVKANLDLLEQEIVSGSGISWAICKFAPHPRQSRQHPTTQFFYRPDALPAAQPTASKH